MARTYAQTKEFARTAIEQHGALLVYPLVNRRDPVSLWQVLHPRVEMRWAWDQGADDRVVKLWQLREELAREKQVVYGKWFRGRAVFFPGALFVAMLAVKRQVAQREAETDQLSEEARELLQLLKDDSPQSTKQLRREVGLTGRPSERVWTRAMRELWERLLIVGVGEVDDGAFPSLAVGATEVLFEELWEEATGQDEATARAFVKETLERGGSAFAKAWQLGLLPGKSGRR